HTTSISIVISFFFIVACAPTFVYTLSLHDALPIFIAPVAAALWRYQDPVMYLSLARTLAKDAEVPHDELIAHLAAVGYARTEMRSEEHTSELQSRGHLVCRLLLEKKK